jgi:hypothetical protein
VESALVYAVRESGVLVFVPAYQLRGAIRMVDRSGVVRLPASAPGDDDDGDAFAVARRRGLALQTGAWACMRGHQIGSACPILHVK